MKVVILAGGRGTRLREETAVKPKPMVEIGEEPILWHIMKLYAAHGFHRFVICLGYKGEIIRDYVLDYELKHSDLTVELGSREIRLLERNHDEASWQVTLADTGIDTMTAGRVRGVRKYLGDEPFMLTYGDGVADIDIGDLVDFHRRSGKVATVTGVRPSSRFGELRIDDDGIAESFSEKPQVHTGWINGGFFVLEPEVFDFIPEEDVPFERAPMERLVSAGELAVYRHEGYWRCMDTYRDLEALNEDWNEGDAPWKTW